MVGLPGFEPESIAPEATRMAKLPHSPVPVLAVVEMDTLIKYLLASLHSDCFVNCRIEYSTHLYTDIFYLPVMKEQLREKIAGEITLSTDAGKTIRKWREEFGISQQDLARQLAVSPSVISDYESGRRKSPGIVIVRRMVDGLINIDETRGGKTLKKYDLGKKSECVISMKEFKTSMSASDFIDAIEGENMTRSVSLDRDIHGYTVIDSVTAITSLSSFDYLQIYGWSSERALIFTGVKYGRSPMIAIRAHPLKPAMVGYHKPEHVDELAIRLATLEGIPLIKTGLPMQALVERLERLG